MTPWFKWLDSKKSILREYFVQSDNLDELYQIERIYNPMKCLPNYALECSLQDESLCDYSTVYDADYMFKYETDLKCGEKWYELSRCYAQKLEKQGEEALNNGTIYLEIDSSKGRKDAAIFFNLRKSVDLLPVLMEKAGYTNRLKTVYTIVSENTDEAILLHVGFMTTRRDAPVRLVLNTADACNVVKKLAKYGVVVPSDFLSVAKEFKDKFQFMIDLDVLDNGRIGSVLGLELLMPRNLLSERRDDFVYLIHFLQEQNYVDDRVSKLERICEEVEFFDEKHGTRVSMETEISHFKLRWNKNELLPTKIYFHIAGYDVV